MKNLSFIFFTSMLATTACLPHFDEIVLIKSLKKFCQKNKNKLLILGKDHNSGPEEDFYNDILGDLKFKFIKIYLKTTLIPNKFILLEPVPFYV